MLSLAGLVSELVTDIIRTTKPAIWFTVVILYIGLRLNSLWVRRF